MSSAGWNFDNSYARLPPRLFHRQHPEKVPSPRLIRVNHALAEALGLNPVVLSSPEGVEVFAGNLVPEGAEPLAMAYGGHQFGAWNPGLGDGRALLLGEVVAPSGERFDLHLKGTGRTPFSRAGDGKAPLGPVLREYVVSEAMAALGVPTSRSLAAVTTGEMVLRVERQPGAVLCRVARSHIRIGTFELLAAKDDREGLSILTDHALARHYPDRTDTDEPAQALLDAVVERQAELVARWQALGFIHGVMNTDNMLVSGETVDYGPCAFMDQFDPNTVFSSIDHQGRYAYRNQPGIAHWNLACLARALIPILDADPERAVQKAQAAVDRFAGKFLAAMGEEMSKKLGLSGLDEDDEKLIDELFDAMSTVDADFTLTFRRLTEFVDPPSDETSVSSVYELKPELQPWVDTWRRRFERDELSAVERIGRMRRANPAIIPRNHRVEAVIRSALDHDDLQPFHDLVDVLSSPFEYGPGREGYAAPPQPDQEVRQTFCGT